MAVKIRLKRMGKIRAPYYRIVVADSRTKRDGRVIEEIGKYHPKLEPSLIEVDSDRAQYWLGVGAQPSEPVMALLRKTGDWQHFKGEPAPPPLLLAETRRDRNEIFNEALKESAGEPETEAVTRRRTAKKAAPVAAPVVEPTAEPTVDPSVEPTAEQVPADAVPADETPDGATAAAEQSEVEAVDAEIKQD